NHPRSATFAANSRERGQVGAATADDVQKRSIDLMTAWIKAEIASGKAPVSQARPKFLRWIRDAIRARVHKYISKGV
ncbi:MAG TPA: hypothetical protein VF619_09800, partial [Allosphingosinicella sp.]